MTDPHAYCQEKVAASGSSFSFSFRFLSADKRQAMNTLYAFCREVDDVVDECRDIFIAQAKLDWWRSEVAAAFDGQPQHPVAQALKEVAPRFGLPREQFLEIIDGMQMDLQQSRYNDWKSLQLYCYRVASVVGLLSATIFGYTERQTLKYAHDLGLAFQLTNIIRDVGEDARRGRIYLPVSELQRFEVPAKDILESRYSDNFRRLMEFQAQRAQGLYDQAFAHLPQVDRKAQLPGLMMAAIYRSLLDEITADGFLVLDRRTSLTPRRKLWLATRCWMRG